MIPTGRAISAGTMNTPVMIQCSAAHPITVLGLSLLAISKEVLSNLYSGGIRGIAVAVINSNPSFPFRA
jgi:hypothetical protein